MLYWLLQSESAHPALAQGQAPDGLLASEEQSELDHYTSQARRRDWLLGRWTAKRLLQQIAEQHCGYKVPLEKIVIRTAPDGAPLTAFRQPLTDRQFTLSLSHSRGYALCGILEGRGIALGVDLEWVAPRARDFTASFLSAEEEALIDKCVLRLYDLHVNAIWSAKESVLKALRPQKRLDRGSIHCLIQPVASEPQNWIPFPIMWDSQGMPQNTPPRLMGWWQTLGGFVLTLVTPA